MAAGTPDDPAPTTMTSAFNAEDEFTFDETVGSAVVPAEASDVRPPAMPNAAVVVNVRLFIFIFLPLSIWVPLIIHFGGQRNLFVPGCVRQKPLYYPNKAHFVFLAGEPKSLLCRSKAIFRATLMISQVRRQDKYSIHCRHNRPSIGYYTVSSL
jgi:hypothetical protein